MTNDLDQLRGALDSGAPLTWVFTGDSITHGLIHTRGERNYVDHLHEFIRGDLGRHQDVVINTAITGWRADLILEDFDRRVGQWQPSVVTMMIGTNDCTTLWLDPVIEVADFSASIHEFVRRVRAVGAIPVLQTPPTVDNLRATDRARIDEFAQSTRDVAAADGVILVDQMRAFTGLSVGTGPGNEDIAWGYLDDAIHPSAAGHAVLALELVQTLGLADIGRQSAVLTDLAARVVRARHPQWPPTP